MQERLAALNTGWHTFLQVDLCSFLETASGLLDISKGSELMLVNPCSFRNKPNMNDCLLVFAEILQTSIILPFLLPFKQHLLEEAADLGSQAFSVCAFFYISLLVLCIPLHTVTGPERTAG